VDSFVLHGPASHSHWTTDDFETWQAMIKERDAGRTRLLGVSNISLGQLQQMARAHAEPPAFVQNRCYASRGWDREVRAFCRERNIVYQGFSLLTANVEVLRHRLIAELSTQLNATPAQIVFAFARQVGMLPLTGTTNAEHMQQDLASLTITLAPHAVRTIESIAG
jgi:diketogulonate reductase-like aldo/keto reductase